MSARPVQGFLMLASSYLLPVSLYAACDCAPMAISGLQFSCFSITVSGTSAQRTEVSEGINAWQSGCNSGGLTIPRMQVYDATTHPNPCSAYQADQVFNIQISFIGTQPAGRNPECGFADINFTARSGSIEVYGQANDGGSCTQRQEDVVSHELGHHLGFGDISSGCQLTCSGRMMSGDIYQSGTVVDRSVTSEDCSRADQMNSPSPPLPPTGGTNPCSGTIPTDSSYLTVAGTATTEIDTSRTPLFTRRSEVVEGFTYIMEDWAVVSFGRSTRGKPPAMRVERSSSSSFAPGWGRELSDKDVAGVGLLIEAPAHLHNSRHIPTPEARLRPTAIPYVGQRVTAVLRIDVGEDRQIRDVQILHTLGMLPLGIDLIELIRSNFEVLYRSSQRHRVIVFAIVDLVDGRVLLRQGKVVLPRCCCNPICI